MTTPAGPCYPGAVPGTRGGRAGRELRGIREGRKEPVSSAPEAGAISRRRPRSYQHCVSWRASPLHRRRPLGSQHETPPCPYMRAAAGAGRMVRAAQCHRNVTDPGQRRCGPGTGLWRDVRRGFAYAACAYPRTGWCPGPPEGASGPCARPRRAAAGPASALPFIASARRGRIRAGHGRWRRTERERATKL
jgi:hypothetical protein